MKVQCIHDRKIEEEAQNLNPFYYNIVIGADSLEWQELAAARAIAIGC